MASRQKLRTTLDNYFLFKANDEHFALWTASNAFHHPEQFFEMFAWNPHGLSGLDSKVAKYAASIPGLAEEYLDMLRRTTDTTVSPIYFVAGETLRNPGKYETFGQLMDRAEAYTISNLILFPKQTSNPVPTPTSKINPYPATTIEEIADLLLDESIKAEFATNPDEALDHLATRIEGIRKRDHMREIIAKVRESNAADTHYA